MCGPQEIKAKFSVMMKVLFVSESSYVRAMLYEGHVM